MVTLINIVVLVLAQALHSSWLYIGAVGITIITLSFSIVMFVTQIPYYVDVLNLVHNHGAEFAKSEQFEKVVKEVRQAGFTTEGEVEGYSFLISAVLVALYAFDNQFWAVLASSGVFFVMVLMLKMHARTWYLLQRCKANNL